ncbi:transcription factor Sox-6 [Trichonephila clavipes]|nr:transcription factor Sox-6 [Trichonephila clavipes]
MIWAGITLDGRTHLHVIERDSVTAEAHRAHLVDQLLESEDSHRMDRSVRSPNLIRMEHIGDPLQRAIATRKHLPGTIEGLKTALLNVCEWYYLPQELKNSFIPSKNLSVRPVHLKEETMPSIKHFFIIL